jgi:hypothetical protein
LHWEPGAAKRVARNCNQRFDRVRGSGRNSTSRRRLADHPQTVSTRTAQIWCTAHWCRARDLVCTGLRRQSTIVVQDATESFATRDRCSGSDVLVGRAATAGAIGCRRLVVALEMVVVDKFRDRNTEVEFTERSELSRCSDRIEGTKRSSTDSDSGSAATACGT